MGVRELWNVLAPYSTQVSIHTLNKNIVAIDLAGWVCESAYGEYVNPRQYLRNLYFRTCCLIWEEIIPVFVLDGSAPSLKLNTVTKRANNIRGVNARHNRLKKDISDRTKFKYLLRNCETLLKSMGVSCLWAPGEAEAYCAFLNKHGCVDGVISQDSDCFAYGAIRVYRNFSLSTRTSLGSGTVDIYDMDQIRKSIDFGQNKAIVMALLCGCDYYPERDGIGRDVVLKLFSEYVEGEILDRLRSWRNEDSRRSEIEVRAHDKTICSNCGYLGTTQSNGKRMDNSCRRIFGCNEHMWNKERLAIRYEVLVRKKLSDPTFPLESIIKEFISEPSSLPCSQFTWGQPNIVNFIKQVSHLMQWTEIYCFQKFFPLFTRWQVRNFKEIGVCTRVFVVPKMILKKHTINSVLNLKVLWEDEKGFFKGLIPHEQLVEFGNNNINGLQDLWVTTEPLKLMKEAYKDIVQHFLAVQHNLDNMQESTEAFHDVVISVNPVSQHFFTTVKQKRICQKNCSLTPNNKCVTLYVGKTDYSQRISSIVDEIINRKLKAFQISKHEDRTLFFEQTEKDLRL